MCLRITEGYLDDVLRYLTSETQATIRGLTEKIHETNEGLVHKEELATESHRKQLEAQLTVKSEELRAHDTGKPTDVPEPARNAELQEALKGALVQITQTRTELETIGTNIATLQRERAEAIRHVSAIDKAVSRIDNFARQYQDLEDARPPDRCTRVIESYAAAGVEHFVINAARPIQEVPAAVASFANEVMARFR